MKFNFLKKYVALAALAAVFTLQSCSDDPEPVKPGEDGFFIVNEGTFNASNTSISFYDRSTNTVTNNVFAAVNGLPLGDQSQSMTVINGRGYVVVQGSQKIEVIDANTYASIATIAEGLSSPRYLIAVSSTKAYISDWGDGSNGTIKVLDLTTNKITKTIEHVGMGTNKLLKVGSTVYAANAGSTLGDDDNTVTMIDTNTDTITGDPLEVAENPNSLQVDKDANLWVATVGDVVYLPDYSDIDYDASTPGSLVKINANKSVAPLKLYVDDVTYTGVSHLSISTDASRLYYIYKDAIYSMSTSATTLPTTPFKAADHYYGLAVDPFDGNIIACKAPNFSSAGSVEIIDANGTVKGSFATGIAPNGVAFK
jgi:hypothetical protein